MKLLKLILSYWAITFVCVMAGFWKSHSFNPYEYGYHTSIWLGVLWVHLASFATLWYIIPFNSDKHGW